MRVLDDHASKLVATSWIEDGLPSLVLGLTLTLTGGLFLLAFAFAKRIGPWMFFIPLAWGGICLTSRWSLIELKRRITFPRLGYVELLPPSKSHFVTLVLVVLTIAISAITLFTIDPIKSYDWTRLMGPLAAIPILFASLVSWYRYRFPEGLWLFAVCAVVGIWTYHTRADLKGIPLLLIWIGGTLMLVGAHRLYSFRKRLDIRRLDA